MRLIVEMKRDKEDYRVGRETRYETEIGWDADGGDYVDAFAAFMFGRTFSPDTIADSFRSYVEVYDAEDDSSWREGVWDRDEDEDDWEEDLEADADEKTAPTENGSD